MQCTCTVLLGPSLWELLMARILALSFYSKRWQFENLVLNQKSFSLYNLSRFSDTFSFMVQSSIQQYHFHRSAIQVFYS